MYREINRLGLVRDNLVPEVEFGDEADGTGLKLLQIRAGVRREVAQFKLGRDSSSTIALAIGVTEGIELPVLHGDIWGEGSTDISNGQSPYALMRTHHIKRPLLNFMPRAMTAYLGNFSCGSGYPSLEHNQFSLIQKAGVAILERKFACAFKDLDRGGDCFERPYDCMPSIPRGLTGDRIRIISDGIHATVELIK